MSFIFIITKYNKFYGHFARVPVYEQRIDNIVGIAYAMDVLEYVEKVNLNSVWTFYSVFC